MDNSSKFGFISIVGKPNTGKSTLINAFVERKIAIISSKPETTRDSIRGIVTDDNSQAVYIDTPGIHKPHLLLGRLMVNKASDSILLADLVIFLVDVVSGITEADHIVKDKIIQSGKKALCVINKIDAVSKSRILPIINTLKDDYSFMDFIPISAMTGENIHLVRKAIIDSLPFGDRCYDKAVVTDKDDIFISSEIIREKALMFTKEEVPHSLAVTVEVFSDTGDKCSGRIDIQAVLYVERESQKGILIGQKGAMVQKISIASRKELEKRFDKKVSLRVIVKVLKNWRRSEIALKRLGIN
jgi:GTPase